LIAVAAGEGFIAMLSPLLMTFLLLQVTGAALLEKSLVKTKPQVSVLRKTHERVCSRGRRRNYETETT
jgi:steroid 5-alpha reductase family enzyme